MRLSSDATSGSRRGRPVRPARPARSSPATGAPVDASLPPQILSPESVLALQRRAGNAAVTSLMTQAGRQARPHVQRAVHKRAVTVRSLQRDALTAKQDPKHYTDPAGVTDVESSGFTRREVHDLKYGLDGGFQDSYTGKSGAVDSAEKQMTKEKPGHMAVVIMPDHVDVTQPTQVILHFHGFGFRGGTDPYAGYLVASGESDSKVGTTRDVDQEHWEQQIGAIAKERAAKPGHAAGPQVIAIMVQGRGMSDFGNVPTFDYVQDVFGHVPELKAISQYDIILSAHSAGGSQGVAKKVGTDALTEDRKKLGAADEGKADRQPADLVVLYDAEGVETVTKYVISQLANIASVIADDKATPADVQAAIAATPKFRGYFAAHGYYTDRYVDSNKKLWEQLYKLPEAWTDLDGNPKDVRLPDLFRFIAVPVVGKDHEHVISGRPGNPVETGSVADSLRASLDPTIDRAQAVTPPARPKPPPPKAAVPPKKADKPKAPASAQPLQRIAASTVQRDSPVPPPPDKAVPPPAWKPSNATSEYKFTDDDKKALAAQTPEQRADDEAAYKAGRDRLAALLKAKKKRVLTDGETTELADLQKLKDRTEFAQRALKRLDVEQVLADAGPYTTAAWYGGVESGTFLGVPLRVHRALAERLTRAETALVGDTTVNPSGLDAKALGVSLKMTRPTSDLRAPGLAVGGTVLSMHTFGLAVDLNFTGNPFLGNRNNIAPDIIKRATSLVHNASVNVLAEPSDPKTGYETLKKASDDLVTYLSYRLPANEQECKDRVSAHTPAPGEPTDYPGWLTKIKKDFRDISADGDFDEHTPPEQGFIDLDKSVVLALTGAGLTWGGTYPGAKDIMHFDLREAEGAKIDRARKAHSGNT